MRLTVGLLRKILVARSISLKLLLVPGLLSWLQINSSTCAMFAEVRAERFRPQLRLLDVPVESICLINRCRAYLFHFLKGNSIIIYCALHPFVLSKFGLKFYPHP